MNGKQYVFCCFFTGSRKDESIVALTVDELIEKQKGLACVFPNKILFSK